MPPPVPLFVGAVGGPELLVIVLVALLLFSPLLVAVLVAVGYLGRRRTADDRVEELEDEVSRLQERLEARDDPDAPTGDTRGTPDGDTRGEPGGDGRGTPDGDTRGAPDGDTRDSSAGGSASDDRPE